MSTEVLRQCAPFKGLTSVGLEIFAKIAKPRILLTGKVLFAEGKPSESLYLVAEGRLGVRVKGPDGHDAPVASLGAGEHMGEMALLATGKQAVHLCTVVAEADSKVLEISAADFRTLLKDKPQACMKLLLALSAELGQKAVDAGEPLRFLMMQADRR